MNKKLLAIGILSFIASINASYLTYSAYQLKSNLANGSFCDISHTFSCSSVFNYDFAWFGNIPFPAIALIVYPILVVLTLGGIKGNIKKAYLGIFVLSFLGLLFNTYIIYNEYTIGTYCILCLLCTIIIVINLILSVLGIKDHK